MSAQIHESRMVTAVPFEDQLAMALFREILAAPELSHYLFAEVVANGETGGCPLKRSWTSESELMRRF